MKRFLSLLTLLLACTALFTLEAEAKRLGGGSSFGKQRSMAPQQQKAAPATPANQPAAAPAKPGNKWLGPLAGLAAGLGLAALFSSLGMGEGMGMLLMILLGGAALFFVISMLRRKQTQPAMQYAGASASPYAAPASAAEPVAAANPVAAATVAAPAAASIPADFPVDSFLRSAKTSFIRLQAANDRKDLDDIREYTTPEMFAEISMQIRERDDTPQTTDVQALDAQLLEVTQEGQSAIASVRLTGQLSENKGPAESFDEIWHVEKDLGNEQSVWLLAGIQQTSH